MGRRVTRKLKSESGVTLVLALVFFLICAVIGSVVIAAATSASGRMAGLVEQQQSYYTVSSAAEYFRDVTESRTVTLRQTGEKKDGMLEPKFGDPTLELSSEEEKSRVITAAVEGLLQSHGSSYQRNLTVHVDGSSFRDANGPAIDNDPEKYDARCQEAVGLLLSAGYSAAALERMNPVTLLYESNAVNVKVAQMLQAVWRDKLGIRVSIRGVSPEDMMTVLKNGEFSLALTDVNGDRNTALSYLNRFSSDQQENYGQFYSNAYDMLIRVAANSSSDTARDAYLADAEKMLLDSGYVIPLYNETYTWLLRDTLTGIQTDGMGVYYFQNVVEAAS